MCFMIKRCIHLYFCHDQCSFSFLVFSLEIFNLGLLCNKATKTSEVDAIKLYRNFSDKQVLRDQKRPRKDKNICPEDFPMKTKIFHGKIFRADDFVLSGSLIIWQFAVFSCINFTWSNCYNICDYKMGHGFSTTLNE